MNRKISLLLILAVILVSGCVREKKLYVCPYGSIVEDPELCPTTLATTTTTTSPRATTTVPGQITLKQTTTTTSTTTTTVPSLRYSVVSHYPTVKLRDGDVKKTDEVFLVTRFKVTNIGEEQLTLNREDVFIIDSTNAKYYALEDGVNYFDDYLLSYTIDPRESRTLTLVFEVPKSAEGLLFQIGDNMPIRPSFKTTFPYPVDVETNKDEFTDYGPYAYRFVGTFGSSRRIVEGLNVEIERLDGSKETVRITRLEPGTFDFMKITIDDWDGDIDIIEGEAKITVDEA